VFIKGSPIALRSLFPLLLVFCSPFLLVGVWDDIDTGVFCLATTLAFQILVFHIDAVV